MNSYEKYFSPLVKLLIIMCIIISIWGVYDRIILKAIEDPYHKEWPFYLAVFFVMSIAGYSFIKPTIKVIYLSLLLVGLLSSFLLMIAFVWLVAGTSGNPEGYLYAIIVLIPSIIFIIIFVALLMKKKAIKERDGSN